MKVYVVSQGNDEFHRVEMVDSDWNRAVKYAVEELEADDRLLRDGKKEYEGQIVWQVWGSDTRGHEGGVLTRVTQLDLS